MNVGVVGRTVDRVVPEENEILIVVRTDAADRRPTAVEAARDPVREAGHRAIPIPTVLARQAAPALPTIPVRVLLPRRSKM